MRLDEAATVNRFAWLVVAIIACKTRGPVRTTPQELFADFTRPSGNLLDKYRDGATFTATVKTVGQAEGGTPVVMIDVDGTNIIALDFIDAPIIEVGETVTVTCKLGGASGALMMVTECVI